MKITDFKNEDALEVLANIIEPASKILGDAKIKKVFAGKKFNRMEVVKYLLKNHQKSIVEIMAALNGVPYEEYEFNIISGTKQLVDVLNDEELISFFQSQGQIATIESSGSATENIKATED